MLSIRPLADEHKRASFYSGEPALDSYLRETANQHTRRDLARTFVLVDEQTPNDVMGYFTLTLCMVEASDLPSAIAKRLPRKLPGVKLGRLAVSVDHQGQGHGGRLLIRALMETAAIAERAGTYALFVDAKRDSVVPFYRRYGFDSFPSQPLVLFLTTAAIRKVLGAR